MVWDGLWFWGVLGEVGGKRGKVGRTLIAKSTKKIILKKLDNLFFYSEYRKRRKMSKVT